MSLILDALRKADAERERGAVPGLHAQPVAGDDDGDDAQGSGKRGGLAWLWPIVGALVGLLVLVAGWHVISPSTPAVPAAAPQTAAPVAVAPPPAMTVPAAPQDAPAAAPPAPATPASSLAPPAPWSAPERKAEPAPTASANAAAARSAAASRPAAPAAAAAPAPTVPTVPTAATAAASTAAPGAASAASAGATNRAGNPPPAAETAAYVAEQLPASVRAQLPPLAFGGSIYSRTPANRSLVINGRSYREGELIAPGLVLEQIGPRAAILGFRGYRIEVPL